MEFMHGLISAALAFVALACLSAGHGFTAVCAAIFSVGFMLHQSPPDPPPPVQQANPRP